MSTYTIKFQDRSDRQCWGNLEIDIPISNLTQEQVLDIVQDGECQFTREEAINCRLKLSKDEEESLQENDTFYREVGVKGDTICGACGSDYTRDDDGNIID